MKQKLTYWYDPKSPRNSYGCSVSMGSEKISACGPSRSEAAAAVAAVGPVSA
ncbi:unnamed protein product [Chondrus crispus]|uniref:Uncharacterized protein n=1 Tax=Chondrus crispus TaxID=2769 RepID=R7QU16_CHOCR|nr:unnamed protein product [Chondrus crispus]CDF41203.1 unnamed protein product [Chondrus crispus]|eukprot:XP_005711497.1 unnamed protein product [Chondrus crispus]